MELLRDAVDLVSRHALVVLCVCVVSLSMFAELAVFSVSRYADKMLWSEQF